MHNMEQAYVRVFSVKLSVQYLICLLFILM
jgi:hypothetical protein